MFGDTETTTRKFSKRTHELLLEARSALVEAERAEGKAQTARDDIAGLLIDLFGLLDAPGDATYKLDDHSVDSEVVSVELNIEWVPNGEKMFAVLGSRVEEVMTLRPHFDPKKAQNAINQGIITEAEMAQCLQPIAHPYVSRHSDFEAEGKTPTGIKPGEGRVKPLDLPKGLKLQWGERG